MAHGVTDSSPMSIHQAVHGYADGHRQLALTAPLKPKDQKTLLALSDISGTGVRFEEDGYITGYPLTESGYYAVGRTWPATEFHRPGCVWTHTLLIEFSDLAVLDSFEWVLDVFRRPEDLGNAYLYSEPLEIQIESNATPQSVELGWCASVLSTLYGEPNKCTIAPRIGGGVDSTVLAIWSQQWPRLRRNFRFCTLSANDRSINGAEFDLQLISVSDRGARSRFSDVIVAGDFHLTGGEWLKYALDDLQSPDVDSLRTFLRKVGAELTDGRQAFIPLTQFFRALISDQSAVLSIQEAIEVLNKNGSIAQSKTLRALVVEKSISVIDQLNEELFSFVWGDLMLAPYELIKRFAGKIGAAAWCRDPSLVLDVIKSRDFNDDVNDILLSGLSVEQVISGLKQYPDYLKEILERRSEIVRSPDYWMSSSSIKESMNEVLRLGLQGEALIAMIKSGRDDLPLLAKSVFGANLILDALCKISLRCGHGARHGFDEWVQAAASDLKSVYEFLLSKQGISRELLFALARVIPPVSPQSYYENDPWLTAWRCSSGIVSEDDTIEFMAHMLARAFSSRPRFASELSRESFSIVYAAIVKNRISEQAWRILDACLTQSIIWWLKGRAEKIEHGVVDMFVERGLPPIDFLSLTRDALLFSRLVKYASQRKLGRIYLRRIMHFFKNDKPDFPVAFSRIVEEAIERD
ncbi:MAG: hypothetical protein V7688_11090 [Alcanivorax jadensis]|uniref:GAP1-N1 domain-containing protein n=1 Tax=Alcanivorax jadensis TaxID=64988 RepID=UPI0030025CC0